MKLLLDTCTFLWASSEPERLSERARRLFADPGNELFLSVVSAWEVAVKHSLGRLPLPEPPMTFIASRRKAYSVQSLPLEEEAALNVARLPKLHTDPFDRLLVSQAVVHGLAILTPDEQIAQYAVRILW